MLVVVSCGLKDTVQMLLPVHSVICIFGLDSTWLSNIVDVLVAQLCHHAYCNELDISSTISSCVPNLLVGSAMSVGALTTPMRPACMLVPAVLFLPV